MRPTTDSSYFALILAADGRSLAAQPAALVPTQPYPAGVIHKYRAPHQSLLLICGRANACVGWRDWSWKHAGWT